MAKRPRIGVVGSSNVDLVTYVDRMPVWGETIAAPRFEMSHGGKGANQAVAAAKLGAAVVMVSKVGDDMLGDGILQIFERTGVDARHVERANGQSTGTATILVDKSGDNCILIVKGANGDLTPEDVERGGDDLFGFGVLRDAFAAAAPISRGIQPNPGLKISSVLPVLYRWCAPPPLRPLRMPEAGHRTALRVRGVASPVAPPQYSAAP